MHKLILLLFISTISTTCISQDLVFKKWADSILVSRSHWPVKKFKARIDGTETTYVYDKKTKSLSVIAVTGLDMDNIKWRYYYYFINGRLAMVSKMNWLANGFNDIPNAYYYFKNSALVYKEENKTYIEDPEKQLKVADDMRSNAPKY